MLACKFKHLSIPVCMAPLLCKAQLTTEQKLNDYRAWRDFISQRESDREWPKVQGGVSMTIGNTNVGVMLEIFRAIEQRDSDPYRIDAQQLNRLFHSDVEFHWVGSQASPVSTLGAGHAPTKTPRIPTTSRSCEHRSDVPSNPWERGSPGPPPGRRLRRGLHFVQLNSTIQTGLQSLPFS
jgi:hypothetical protein